MRFKKPHFIADKTLVALSSMDFFAKNYEIYPLSKADVIVVLGGDGFMLDILKKKSKLRFTILWYKSRDCWFFDESKTRKKFDK